MDGPQATLDTRVLKHATEVSLHGGALLQLAERGEDDDVVLQREPLSVKVPVECVVDECESHRVGVADADLYEHHDSNVIVRLVHCGRLL